MRRPRRRSRRHATVKGKDGIARAIYVTAKGERVVVVHAFVKKAQKTPQSALETARQRAKEVT